MSYAYKKDTKGERHGSAAGKNLKIYNKINILERLLAANRPNVNPTN